MTDNKDDAFRAKLIAAVQSELERHARKVAAETDKIRADAAKEREMMHRLFGDQLQSLQQSVEKAQARNDELNRQLREQVESAIETQVRQAIAASEAATEKKFAAMSAKVVSAEDKLAEAESRSNRRIEEVVRGLDGMIETAAHPLFQAVRDEQANVERRIDGLDEHLRKFDEQAARMVVFFNETTEAQKQRTDAMAEQLTADVDRRIGELVGKVEDSRAESVRQHAETTKLVAERAKDIEDRINQRVMGFEARVNEETGRRIADIDAHVGKVATGLDVTLTALNDRLAGIETRIDAVDEALAQARAEFAKVNTDELDELKEKLSAAAGEAVLLRIDMEKMGKSIGERVDAMALRVTDVETQLVDATMDVSTAVQLERLEELERAVIELDPTRFVLRTDLPGGQGAPSGQVAPAVGFDAPPSGDAVSSVDDGGPSGGSHEPADDVHGEITSETPSDHEQRTGHGAS